jgi:hypothetical protein
MTKLIATLRNFASAPKPVLNEVPLFDLLRTRRNVFHLKSYFVPRSKHYLGFKNISVDVIEGKSLSLLRSAQNT